MDIHAKIRELEAQRDKINDKIEVLRELVGDDNDVESAVNNAPQVKHEAVVLPMYTKAPSLEERLGVKARVGANGEKIIEEWLDGSEQYNHLQGDALTKGSVLN